MRCGSPNKVHWSAALLGISQRTITIQYQALTPRKPSRKLIPVEVKTLGDWLQIKRIEANLSQAEVAQRMGVGDKHVRAWEHDQLVPTETEWIALSKILPCESGLPRLELGSGR